jgi:hypothetical protein
VSGAIEKFNAALGYALDPAGDYLPAQARLMVFVAQLRGRGDIANELALEFGVQAEPQMDTDEHRLGLSRRRPSNLQSAIANPQLS